MIILQEFRSRVLWLSLARRPNAKCDLHNSMNAMPNNRVQHNPRGSHQFTAANLNISVTLSQLAVHHSGAVQTRAVLKHVHEFFSIFFWVQTTAQIGRGPHPNLRCCQTTFHYPPTAVGYPPRHPTCNRIAA